MRELNGGSVSPMARSFDDGNVQDVYRSFVGCDYINKTLIVTSPISIGRITGV
jgi:hypothetical protein